MAMLIGWVVCAGLGVLAGDYLSLKITYRYVQPSAGYLNRAVKKLLRLHSVSLLTRTFIVVVIFYLSLSWLGHLNKFPFSFILLFVLGFSVVLVGTGADYLFQAHGSEKLYLRFYKFFLKAFEKIDMSYPYGYEIQRMKEYDNVDLQDQKPPWDVGISDEELSRRLRVLYEKYKLAIANQKKKPALAQHRLLVDPYQNFYLLVEFLGRDRLMREVREGTPLLRPERSWEGDERRRENKSKQDRADKTDIQYARRYDAE